MPPNQKTQCAPAESRIARGAGSVETWCDLATEGILWLMILFSPWAFGTTEEWSMFAMNLAGYALGVLLLTKWIVRTADRCCIQRRVQAAGGARIVNGLLAGATILVLAYCLVSAVNARCVYLGDFQYKYFDCLNWLPHSYDARLTWQAFWNYLALAIDFWAVRDWLMTMEPGDRARVGPGGTGDLNSRWLIPRRLNRLLWLLALNGAVLAAEGILQRVMGAGKLLWLVEPHINKAAEAQFGPYAYRSNAAQYFLLVWPVVFGFWYVLRRRRREGGQLRMHNHLLPCILIMAIVPLMSLSRAGAIVGGAAIIAAVFVVLRGGRQRDKRTLAVSSLLGLAALLGGGLEWEHLAKRFDSSTLDPSRLEIWRNTWQAFTDTPVFGTGPGTFSSAYSFYWSGNNQGTAQAHNDWLELLMTFGIAGSVLVLTAALLLLLAHRSGRICLGKAFPKFIYIALGSCLLYAAVDFPLTIYSILFLFIVECAVLSCVSLRGDGVRTPGT